MSFYSTVKHFDTSLDGSQIKVKPFLESSRGIVTLVEKLGKAFFPVRSDITGNIEKIRTKYEEDPSRFENLYDLLKDEKEQVAKTKTQACEGALWLSRGLKFMAKFMEVLVQNYKDGKSEDSIKQAVSIAYKTSLEQYHGFIVRKTFSVVALAAPSRADLMKSLKGENNTEEDQIMKEMDEYQSKMVPVLEILDAYFKEFGMDNVKA